MFRSTFAPKTLMCLLWLCPVAATTPVLAAPIDTLAPAPKALPMPGEAFDLGGHQAFLIAPQQPAAGKPWVWYAPTLPGLPGAEENWMFEKFLAAGIAIAGIDAGESYGSPNGCKVFQTLYDELTTHRGMSKKPCFLARSRGGLMAYNWAADHPDNVSGIAGIYPVCDLRSYPGLDKACGAYELPQAQFEARLAEFNPVGRIAPLVKAGVPIFHLHGDDDKVVPLEQNSAALAAAYWARGGKMELSIIKGQGHNMWRGWFESRELVAFVLSIAGARTAPPASPPK